MVTIMQKHLEAYGNNIEMSYLQKILALLMMFLMTLLVLHLDLNKK